MLLFEYVSKVQGSLEELGESTLQRLKRRSQSAQGSGDPDCTPPATPIVTPATPSEPDSSTQRVKSPYNKYLVAAVEVAVDALSIDTRCVDNRCPKKASPLGFIPRVSVRDLFFYPYVPSSPIVGIGSISFIQRPLHCYR